MHKLNKFICKYGRRSKYILIKTALRVTERLYETGVQGINKYKINKYCFPWIR